MITTLFLLAFAAAQAPGAGHAADDLSAAKALYVSAAYEDALSRLTSSGATGDAVEIAQYQALCLLALGRTSEAEKTFAQIVVQRPLYTISDSEFSPKIVTLFHDVRRRYLPDAARALYARAKTDYDDKHFDNAAAEFRVLLSVLDDADMGGQDASSVMDLKMLADGFLHLATSAAADAAKPAPAPIAAPPPPPAPDPVPAAPTTPTVFSAADKDVTRPVEIDRKMPDWNPPTMADQHATFRGVLEVVIDEHGAVQSAIIRQPVAAHYDDLLVAAAKDWRFKPAMKNGAPVAYRTFMQIVLQAKK